MSDIRLVTRVTDVEDMKKNGVKLEAVRDSDVPYSCDDRDMCVLCFSPCFQGIGFFTFSYVSVDFLKKFNLETTPCMALFYVDLDNPYEVEYAQEFQKVYDEALKTYGGVSSNFDALSEDAAELEKQFDYMQDVENFMINHLDNYKMGALFGFSDGYRVGLQSR